MPTIFCGVEFENNPSKVIYAGQVLRGRVYLTTAKEKALRELYLKITGLAYCHWIEKRHKKRKSHRRNEEYINTCTTLAGGDESIRLLPGSYHYAFQIYLPPRVPSSIESRYGYIRYKACVFLNGNPLKPDKKLVDVPFTVIKAIDLNMDPILRQPLEVKIQKTFKSCILFGCRQSDPLEITARTPMGGYAPGQTINLQLIARNESNQPVFKFVVELIKVITYHSYSDKRIETIAVTKAETQGCNVNQNKDLTVSIKVPALPPTDFLTSNVIKVKYFIRITGSVARCHINPVFELPISIGSSPIVDASIQLLSAQNSGDLSDSRHLNTPIPSAPSFSQNQDAELSLPVPSAPIKFLNDEPPAYEEATQFGVPFEREFTPKYPVFKCQSLLHSNAS